MRLLGLATVLTVLFLVACAPTKPAAFCKTSISEEIDSHRAQQKDGRVLLDGKPAGVVPEESVARFADGYPPKVLPDGTTGYRETDLNGDWLLITGGERPETPGNPPQKSDRTYFWCISKRKLEEGSRLKTPRSVHEVIRLNSHTYLLLGGLSNGEISPRLEVIDTESRTVSDAGSLLEARLFPGVVVLDSTHILVAGGQLNLGQKEMESKAIEFCNIRTGVCKNLGELCYGRQGATLIMLSPRKVLVFGGWNSRSDDNSRHLPPEIVTLPNPLPD